MFDILFLSYDEPDRETNWQKLSARFPRARHIHGIKGIWRAHKACADAATTESFFVVDGDATVLDSFNFQFETTRALDECVFVWRSINPVNGIVSGFGGIKLFPKTAFDDESDGLDMTIDLAKTFVPIPELGCITRFNASPFTAWRGAFRECAKLVYWANNDDGRAFRKQRLREWCHLRLHKPFGKYVSLGARSGARFGIENGSDTAAFSIIDGYEKLREIFAAEMKSLQHSSSNLARLEPVMIE